MENEGFEHRQFDEDEVEEIREIQQEARKTKIRSQVGSSERLESRIEGAGVDQTLRITEHGYVVDEDGTLVKQTVDSSRVLKCGCSSKEPENVKICSVSENAICSMCSLQCEVCHKTVWRAYANMIRGKVICKNCQKKRWKILPFTALKKVILTVIYGLVGQQWEDDDAPMPLGEPPRTHNEQIPPQAILGPGNPGNGARRIR